MLLLDEKRRNALFAKDGKKKKGVKDEKSTLFNITDGFWNYFAEYKLRSGCKGDFNGWRRKVRVDEGTSPILFALLGPENFAPAFLRIGNDVLIEQYEGNK